MQVSNRQIKDAETAVLQWRNNASVPGFSDDDNAKFRQAAAKDQIKWIIEPDAQNPDIGRLIPLAPGDMGYNYEEAFNTPREAEHFTIGNEPGRNQSAKFIGSMVAPISQHQLADTVRSETRDPAIDIGQDLLRAGKIALPIVTQYMARTPVGAGAAAGLGAIGIGGANNTISALRGEPWYGDTPANILATAATIGLSAAANRYYSPEHQKDLQLQAHLEDKLGYQNLGMFEKSPIEPQLLPEVKARVESGNNYTLGNWRSAPLDRFYEGVGSRSLPMMADRLPYPKEPTKKQDPKTGRYGVGAKVSSRKAYPDYNEQQWDALAKEFKAEAGLVNADLKEIKAFLRDYYRPDSELGELFWGAGTKPGSGFTTTDWAKMRSKFWDSNPAAYEALENVHVEDPTLDAQRAEALKDVKTRRKRLETKSDRTSIVSPQEYKKFGEYTFRLPFIRKGGKPIELKGGRPAIRVGTTLLPFAAQTVIPYAIRKFGGNDE